MKKGKGYFNSSRFLTTTVSIFQGLDDPTDLAWENEQAQVYGFEDYSEYLDFINAQKLLEYANEPGDA